MILQFEHSGLRAFTAPLEFSSKDAPFFLTPP
jgi:hypothetical protein